MNLKNPTLIAPIDGYVFDTHTEIQNEFMERISKHGIDNALAWLEPIKNGTELSYPNVLRFTWEDAHSSGYIFELSKEDTFSDSFKAECDVPFFEADNLEIGEKYFWRVNGGKANCFFTRGNNFRFIKLDGALNVRDLGGNLIKQGMIYRGSDIDTCFKITEKGKAVFKNVLKIKTEMELRKEVDGKRPSAAGEDVILKHLPYRPYKEVFEKEHKAGICNIMRFLSNKNNYPVYVHCLGGADRTGMIALFLRALVGECDELIHLDYELTGLSTYANGLAEGADSNGFRSRNSSYYAEFLDMLEAYAPSEPLSKKVRAFLIDCGVTRECIEKIISIIKVDTVKG